MNCVIAFFFPIKFGYEHLDVLNQAGDFAVPVAETVAVDGISEVYQNKETL